MKKPVFLLILILTISSCAAEKFNSSPLNSLLSGHTLGGSLEENYGYSLTQNINAAEISNLVSTFPKFSNDAVNKEVALLKEQLQNYLYAYDAYNLEGKNRELKQIEKRYKNLQKLRKYLNRDEDEIINRYLVRIKTNISTLETSTLLFP